MDDFEYYTKKVSGLKEDDLILLRIDPGSVGDEYRWSQDMGEFIPGTYVLKWGGVSKDGLIEHDLDHCRDTPSLFAKGEILKPYCFSTDSWGLLKLWIPVGQYNIKENRTYFSPNQKAEDFVVGKEAIFVALDKYELSEFKPLLEDLLKS